MRHAAIDKTDQGYEVTSRSGFESVDYFGTIDLGEALIDVVTKIDQNKAETLGTIGGFEIVEAARALEKFGTDRIKAAGLQTETDGTPDAPIPQATESDETQTEQN